MSEERQVSAAEQEVTEPTGRREALKKMGKYVVYTAPTLTALTLPLDAAAGKAKGKRNGKRNGNGKAKNRPRPQASAR
jgi:hypothetical protein